MSGGERDLRGYGESPPGMTWPGGASVVLSIAVHVEEGAEMSVEDGDIESELATEGLVVEGRRRDYGVESMYEYGTRAGLWRLLRIFATRGVLATFFCCGQSVLRSPPVFRAIVAQGHEIAGRGFRYRPSFGASDAELLDDVRRTVKAIGDVTGTRPVGWSCRTPQPGTRPALLAAGGFLYDSDSFGDDLPHDVAGGALLAVPGSFDVSDEKFWALSNNAGFTDVEDLFDALRDTYDALLTEPEVPRVMPVTLHPRIAGRPAKARQIARFLDHVRADGRAWVATRAQIAAAWRSALGSTP